MTTATNVDALTNYYDRFDKAMAGVKALFLAAKASGAITAQNTFASPEARDAFYADKERVVTAQGFDLEYYEERIADWASD